MLYFLVFSVGAVAIVWVLFSLVLAWENRRYAFVRMATPLFTRHREHRTAVYLPCKGDDGDLRENLEAFFKQKHPNFELNLIVESTDDPALPVIQQVRDRYPTIDSTVVISGVATTDGQKVHNLRVATGSIDPSIRILAFADADIRPDPNWLQYLTIRVAKSKDTAGHTGYRWMLPEKNTLINWLVYSINATLAGTLGSGKHFLIWGGSWAIRRSYFEQLGIREAWRGTLSDDLVASSVIHEARARVRYAPRCLCATHFDMTWSSAVEFLRRQYLIGRKYAPRMFWPGYLILAATITTWMTLVVLAFSQSGAVAMAAGVGASLIYLINIAKGILRQSGFCRKDPVKFWNHRAAACFDILANPLVMTLSFILMTASLFGSRICWRGNHYHIFSDGQIRLLGTRPANTAPLLTEPQRLNKAA